MKPAKEMSLEGDPCERTVGEEAERTATREPWSMEQSVPEENSPVMENAKSTNTQLRANKLPQG